MPQFYSGVTFAFAGGEADDLTSRETIDIISIMTALEEKEKAFLGDLNRAARTIATYDYALRYFNRTVGSKATLTTETYEKFLKSMRDLSPSTQRLYRTAVHKLYTYCKVADEQEMTAIENRQLKRQGKRLIDPNMKAIDKLVKYAENVRGDLLTMRNRAFVLLLVDSGLRISEACSLTRGQMDWDAQKVKLIGKRDKEAIVRLSNRSSKAVKDYLSARQKMDGASGKPLGTLPLFARHDRSDKSRVTRISKNGMWVSMHGQDRRGKHITGFFEEAGVGDQGITPHQLRHYFVTIIVQEKGIETAKILARHESISTTQGYTHLAPSQIDQDYDDVFNRK